MTTETHEFDLDELAAEAAQRDAAARAEYVAAHGPIDHQEAIYGCHGSHGSRSVR